MIPQDFIDELLARTDIVEIIEPRVQLKKTGQNYSGLCPFHGEKTPSFSVSQDKQFYHCFGCQVSGTALKFLMEFERLDFVAAIEMMAAKAGMEVPRDVTPGSEERQQKRKSIYQILDQAAEFYQAQLKDSEGRAVAVDYLKQRGLSGAIARDFGIGYAPKGWNNLYKALAKTNHEHDMLIEGGLLIEKTAKESDDGKEKRYDRFRDRVMFPIRDLRGRTIAFGGRIIGDGKPKYLNSPETSVFHKSRELYGLFEARKRNRKLEQLLVVEGYMDVVALAQHGVNYAVATLGTATTTEHLERLFRMVPRLVFCFDGDNAGRNAAWKALNVALSHMADGRTAKFMFVPDGEDPDSLIRLEGKEKFELRLDGAMGFADFFFQNLSDGIDLADLSGKAELSKIAMPLMTKMPKGVFRELMIDKLAEITNLTSERLIQLSDVEEAPKPTTYQAKPKSANSGATSSTKPEETHPGHDYSDVAPVGDTSGSEYYSDEYAEDDFDGQVPYGYDTQPVEPAYVPPPVMSIEARRIIALLLRSPELASELKETDFVELGSIAGFELMVEVIQMIIGDEIRSPFMLLAQFENRSEFGDLKALAEQEQLLQVADMPGELSEILTRANKQITVRRAEVRKRELLNKPFAEMTAAEKLEIVQLSKTSKA